MRREFTHCTQVETVRGTRCRCWEIQFGLRSFYRIDMIYQDLHDTLKPSTLALWEIVSAVTSCLIAEWVVLAFVGTNKVVFGIPVVLALSLMIVSHRAYGETLHEIG